MAADEPTLRDVMTLLRALDARVEGLDGKVGGLDVRVGGLDARVEGLDARVGGLDAKVESLRNELHTEVKSLRDELHLEVRTLRTDLLGLSNEIKLGRVETLELRGSTWQQLDDVRRRLDTLFEELASFRAEYNAHTHGER